MDGLYREGPYRDLGGGFARLTGPEGARRSPSRVSTVEDVLTELLRNARDAGAKSVYVASVLRRRRYRALTVIDDGCGIPEQYKSLIFEPGVTSRHLNPTLETGRPDTVPHGAGLSLYHIKAVALEARVTSTASPTAISVTLDTSTLPERSLQSDTRPSRSNLLATARNFAQDSPDLHLFYSSPATILATILHNRIIQTNDEKDDVSEGRLDLLRERGRGLGLKLSVGTLRRILRGEIEPAARLGGTKQNYDEVASSRANLDAVGPSFQLDFKDMSEISEILARAARAHYLEIQNLRAESRPGAIILRARVYEPEDEYE